MTEPGGDGASPSAAPRAPASAAGVFGGRLELAEAYVAVLADTGVRHGLIGPREVPRLWDRHVLNSAVVAELVPAGASVVDVGSGAGLPGIPLAIARPDVRVVLVEPLLRRTRWLDVVVAEVGLPNVEVRRARAEALKGAIDADVVTARAVSRLATLADWCAPLLRTEGVLLALKGAAAAEELAVDRAAMRAAGLARAQIVLAGVGAVEPATTVVMATKVGRGPAAHAGKAGRRAHRRP
ncbi:MAG: 16S rRNA (guanine(527)-N(7))-methyltransferase RsmG [Austwickia sp.]|jgi:16S rRNA (guanine527-N7)-methyltransferase|nr:MAG: 16S rRNA (guanine(527)-N(7))-methyltransferase RsmG [Austwickia sp.]